MNPIGADIPGSGREHLTVSSFRIYFEIPLTVAKLFLAGTKLTVKFEVNKNTYKAAGRETNSSRYLKYFILYNNYILKKIL